MLFEISSIYSFIPQLYPFSLSAFSFGLQSLLVYSSFFFSGRYFIFYLFLKSQMTCYYAYLYLSDKKKSHFVENF